MTQRSSKAGSEESFDDVWKHSSDVACSSLSNKANKQKKETFVLYVGDKGSGKNKLHHTTL